MGISIIGGADGPTAVFLASNDSLYVIAAIAAAIIALIGIIIWSVKKKKSKY